MNEIMTRPNGDAPAVQAFQFGPRMAQAWQLAWDKLSAAEWTEGHTLAEEVAAATGIKPVSFISHLHRMAQTGVLVSERFHVETEVTRSFPVKGSPGEVKQSTFAARRKRAFFKIAPR